MIGFFQNIISYFAQAYRGLKLLKHFRLSYVRKVFAFLGRREKITLFVLAIIALVNIFFSFRNFYYAHTTPVPGLGGVYTEGLLGQPTYINPVLAHTETDTSLVSLVYSGLYKYDSKGQLVPDLAASMPAISQDQKQYTIALKHNVKWHNDKAFNADDVVFTIQTIKDPGYKSPLRALWLPVTVEKVDDYTVKFSQKDISGPFIYNLTVPILPKAVWSRIDSQNFLLNESNLKAIGTGPYAIREIQKLPSGKIQSITLDAFTNYYAGRAKIDSVIVKFYDSDQDMLNALHGREILGLGFVALDRSIFIDSGNTSFQIVTFPLPQYQVVFFNLKNKILSDQGVRTALSQAVGRQQIIQDVFKENAVLPTSPWSDRKESQDANMDLANQTLDNAGWKIDPKTDIRTKKNVVLEFTITTNDFLLNSKAAETLANQWKALHIKVNLSVQPTKQVTDTIISQRGFDVLLFPQKFGADPDPFIFWHSSQTKAPGLNISGFADADADKLIAEARNTTNQDTRKQEYVQFDNIMNAKVPALFLTQTEYVYALGKEVKNVGLEALNEPSDRFFDIGNWYMETKRVWK